MSPEDEDKAARLYKRSMKRGLEMGLPLFNFKSAMIELCVEIGQEIPSTADMNKAFATADVDQNGLVDEEEFIELYAHCKEGNVKGLASSRYYIFSEKNELLIATSKANKKRAAAAAILKDKIIARMSRKDKAKARSLYRSALIRDSSCGSEEGLGSGLGLSKFKSTVVELCVEIGYEIPSATDMIKAFANADLDQGG